MSARRQYTVSAVHLIDGLHEHGAPSSRYTMGGVATLHGYVNTYGQDGFACWTFIHRGRRYQLVIDRTITKRGLVTIARRFAADVVAGRVSGSER